jgi:hypothetical protein
MSDDKNAESEPSEEEIVFLKDLVPRKDVKGGGKLLFGQSPEAGPRKSGGT